MRRLLLFASVCGCLAVTGCESDSDRLAREDHQARAENLRGVRAVARAERDAAAAGIRATVADSGLVAASVRLCKVGTITQVAAVARTASTDPATIARAMGRKSPDPVAGREIETRCRAALLATVRAAGDQEP